MNSRLMMSVAAAALIAGSGFALRKEPAVPVVRALQVAALSGVEVLPQPRIPLRRAAP